MKIRTRILIQTLSASGLIIIVLGTIFFFSAAGFGKTAVLGLHELGNSSADLSTYSLELEITEKISRIAQDTALLLEEKLNEIDNDTNRIFAQLLDSTGIGRNGQLFILDHKGNRIYSTDSGEQINFLESANRRLKSLGLSMTLGATGITELVMDGIPVYVAYAPVRSMGWSLGAAVSVQEISVLTTLIENQIWRITENTKKEMNRYMIILGSIAALLLAITLLVTGIIAIKFTGAITVPILALNDGVHEVADGNLSREVNIKTGDELEQLAESFNMMTGQLRKQIEQIAKVTAERQRIDTELDIATQIQMSMLPVNFPPYKSRLAAGKKNEFDLYAKVQPARDVGGDFYDFFFINEDQFVILVADVSGKGIPAALYMAIAKTVIKNRMQSSSSGSGEEPGLALEIINRQLCDNNILDMFVSAWIGILEISTGNLVYINAGHNPPLLKHGNDFEFVISPPDLVLAGMDDTRYHCRRLKLIPGDILFLYTDGIVEAANKERVMYSKEKLKQFLDNYALENELDKKALSEMLLALSADINIFAGGAEQSDDITMLALRINKLNSSSEESALSVSLNADIADLEKLASFVREELEAACCPQREFGKIELVAEEIFVNIVNYAYKDDLNRDDREVIIECRMLEENEKMTMILTFSDFGCHFNPVDFPEPDINLSLEEREAGHLGLLIVKKTMDTINYSRDNGVNRLELTKSWQKEKI